MIVEVEPAVEPEETVEAIEIEIPVYEGDVDIVLEPAEERPPEVIDIPEVVESDTEAAVLPETLPSVDEILAAGPDEPVVNKPAVEEIPIEEPAVLVEADETSIIADAPVVKILQDGYHYIQVGVYGDQQAGATLAVNRIKGWSPVPVVVWTPDFNRPEV